MDHLIKKKWIVPAPYQRSGPSQVQIQSKRINSIRLSPNLSRIGPSISGSNKMSSTSRIAATLSENQHEITTPKRSHDPTTSQSGMNIY